MATDIQREITPEYERITGFEDGKFFSQVTYINENRDKTNAALRQLTIADKATLKMHDEADLRMVISANPAQWYQFEKDHSDIAEGLMSTDEHERLKACRAIKFMHPEWVIQDRL